MNITLSFDLGATTYGQPLQLTWAKGGSGKMEWHLRKDAACQRDDTCLISGITDDVILDMVKAVHERRKIQNK